jgi:hypothetical protein
VGFSAVRYYIKYFEKWYGMEPAEYRKQYKEAAFRGDPNVKVRNVSAKEASRSVKRVNNEIYREYAITSDAGEEEIAINLARGKAADERCAQEVQAYFAKARRHCRPSALLCDIFNELDHLLASTGENYLSSIKISSSKSQKKGEPGIEAAAIFIFGDRIRKTDGDGQEKAFSRLIKVDGLSGKYRLTILHISVDSIRASLRYSKRKNEPGIAAGITDKIAAYPEVSRREITAAGSLVFEVHLKGPESELLVFERIS